MKLFGWGKSKTLQPQTVLQQVKKTDPRSNNHEQDRGTLPLPCKSSKIRKQRGLLEVDDDDYFPSAKSSSGGSPNQNNDEKLQDTIQFVFSLEQEGLFAIGTFALEQLAAIRGTRHHQKQISDRVESCTDFHDEDHLPRIVKPTCEFSSDIYSSGDESDDEEKLKQAAKPDSKALSLYKRSRSPELAGTKPVVLLNELPPELRKTLDPASSWLHSLEPLPYVPLGHWTDSALPPPLVVVLPKDNVDEDYYSSYFCGLFSCKKPTSRSEKAKRISIRRKSAEDSKNFSTKPADQNTKHSLLNFGTNRVPSIEKLAKLWRSCCLQSSARIASERKSCSTRASQASEGTSSNEITNHGEVLTAPGMLSLGPCGSKMRPPGRFFSEDWSLEVAEFRRRVVMHERNIGKSYAAEERRDGENDGGHWIKDDSEYVVLEM